MYLQQLFDIIKLKSLNDTPLFATMVASFGPALWAITESSAIVVSPSASSWWAGVSSWIIGNVPPYRGETRSSHWLLVYYTCRRHFSWPVDFRKESDVLVVPLFVRIPVQLFFYLCVLYLAYCPGRVSQIDF
jgi:hypothetical protein